MAKQASFIQKLLWRLEVIGYDSVTFLLGLLPHDQVSAFGGFLLRKIGPLTSKQSIVIKGLRTAFPEMNDAQIKRLATAQWDNTGRTFAEFPLLHKIKTFSEAGDELDGTSDRIEVRGLKHLRTLERSGKPAVLISGHFANWEAMGSVLGQLKMPIQITYRHINNPYLDKRVREQRKANGTQLFVPKSGATGAKQLYKALRQGQSIALMNDQKFNEGISVPFFGVDAMTAPGPVKYALGANAPLIPMIVKRDKAHFIMTIHDPIDLEKTGDKAADIQAGVKKVNEFMEARIRENPDQWFWVHRRWPKDHYKN